MAAYIGEFVGTILLVLLGDGVCANVNLNGSGFKGSSTLLIALGWGAAGMLPAMCFGNVCAASYNPALTIALCADGSLPWSQCAGYIIAEMLGGFIGAWCVFITFKPQFDASEGGALARGVFCTGPGIRNIPYNMFQEAVATFWLVFSIKGIGSLTTLGNKGAVLDPGMGKFIVFLIIMSCGTSFGGLTGYAMNPARDTAPRIAYATMPIKDKDPDWGYALVPIVGPIIGALCAVALYAALPIH